MRERASALEEELNHTYKLVGRAKSDALEPIHRLVPSHGCVEEIPHTWFNLFWRKIRARSQILVLGPVSGLSPPERPVCRNGSRSLESGFLSHAAVSLVRLRAGTEEGRGAMT